MQGKKMKFIQILTAPVCLLGFLLALLLSWVILTEPGCRLGGPEVCG